MRNQANQRMHMYIRTCAADIVPMQQQRIPCVVLPAVTLHIDEFGGRTGGRLRCMVGSS